MNRRGYRRIRAWLSACVCVGALLAVALAWHRQYRNAAYKQLPAFCRTLLESYGYTPEYFGVIPDGTTVIICILAAAAILCVCLIPLRQERRMAEKRIRELTEYLEKVNTDAPGTLLETREDEFAHLQDEIYKTVTNLYATRDAALRARENYAEHLADIAHQLKTPVTAALLSLQLMEDGFSKEHMEAVRRQLARLSWMEETLLTLSKIDAGTLKLEHARVDLYTALCLSAENLQELLDKKGIQVEIPDRGCVEICGDMEWTMEALMNLLKNCMEHASAGGRICCDYGENPLYAWIRILDDGTGFAPEDLPHLFERFYRGKDAAGNGAGLGLALAYSIFELQNGTLAAYNRPEGGACFEARIYSHRDVTLL